MQIEYMQSIVNFKMCTVLEKIRLAFFYWCYKFVFAKRTVLLKYLKI